MFELWCPHSARRAAFAMSRAALARALDPAFEAIDRDASQ